MLALRTFQGFEDIPAERLAVIAEHTEAKRFDQGDYLFREGRPVTSMHMIIDGEVELRRHGHLLRRLQSRGTAGGLSMLARDPQGHDGVALRDTTTLEIGLEDTEDIFEDNFDILYRVLGAMAADVIQVRRTIGATAGFGEDFQDGIACPSRPMNLVERMFFLRKSMVVAQGRINAIGDMARLAREVRLDRGDALWKAGEPPHDVVVLACGTVACSSGDGTQRFRFGPGDTLGGLDALAGTPHWYDAVAERQTVGLTLDIHGVADVWEDHIELPMELLRRMSAFMLDLLERSRWRKLR